MYQLSRFLLIVAVVLVAIGCTVLVAADARWLLALLVVLAFFKLHARRRRLTALGSARWADERDLSSAGMLDARSGLTLGRIEVRRNVLAATKALFAWRVDSATACRKFLSISRSGQKAMVRLPNAVHTAVFGPSGGGKGVSCVVPFLLTCDESCVVVDFKGENARLTAEHRRKVFGHHVVLIDPYRQVTKTPDTLNPLAFIDKDSPVAIDECNDLADALVIRTGEEKEPHWNESAMAWIAAMLATVVQYGEAESGTRSLQTVRDLLSSPQKLEMALRLMVESDAWAGMLARMGGQLSHFVEKERASTLTTVSRHLRFLDTVAIAESTKASSFDPSALRTGKMTVYVILPPDHMRAQSGFLRMCITSLLRAVTKGGLQEASKVHFILDEAASLGHLDAVDDAVDKYRGYGVRLQLYFQSMGQLKKCFPEGQDQTLLSNTSQVFFGVNDSATAEYVSARLGEATIIVDSGGTTFGRSRQITPMQQETTGWTDSTSKNWQQQARRLLKPEEVMTLSLRSAITFVPGMPPIGTTLLRYYEEKNLGKPVGLLRRIADVCSTFAASATVLLLSIVAASLLILMAEGEPGQPSSQAQMLTNQSVPERSEWQRRP